jgi:hypothetical protein
MAAKKRLLARDVQYIGVGPMVGSKSKSKKKFVMSYTFELLVEAPDAGTAEEIAQDLVIQLESDYHHTPGYKAVKEAGFNFNDDTRLHR